MERDNSHRICKDMGGSHLNGKEVASGVYLYRFRARATDGSHPAYSASGKAMLVK